MNIYAVIEKATGAEVCRYQSDAPVEWTSMPFTTHEHAALASDEPTALFDFPPEAWHIHVGPFFDRFGAYKIPILASADLVIQAAIKDSSVRTYIDLKGRRAELAQVVGLLQSKGFDVDSAAVLDVLPNADEAFDPMAASRAASAPVGAMSSYPATHRVVGMPGGAVEVGVSTDGTVRFPQNRWSTVDSLASMGFTMEAI